MFLSKIPFNWFIANLSYSA